MLERVAEDPDMAERAWAYRSVIDRLLSGDMQQSSAMDDVVEGQMVFIQRPSSVREFNTVLDGVMGGLSTGRVTGTGSMIFDGETSLRNNGGFSGSVRVPRGSFEGADSIRLRCKGDGRTWIIGTRASRSLGGDSYWTRFDTTDGEWITVVVPIGEMERTSFGQPLRGRISPAQVQDSSSTSTTRRPAHFALRSIPSKRSRWAIRPDWRCVASTAGRGILCESGHWRSWLVPV